MDISPQKEMWTAFKKLTVYAIVIIIAISNIVNFY